MDLDVPEQLTLDDEIETWESWFDRLPKTPGGPPRNEGGDPVSECRSCGAEILWAATEHDRKMPLDAVPVDVEQLDNYAGLFVLMPGPLALAATPAMFPGEAFYRSHFATCPEADAWRNRKEVGS